MYYKIKKILLFLLFSYCSIGSLTAQVVQKIGDSPYSLNTSAVFELESKTKGFLPPRMSTLERDGIVAPATGLIIYNVTLNTLEVNEGTSTVPLWNSVKSFLPLAGGIMTGGIDGTNLRLNRDAGTNTTSIGGGTTTGGVTIGGIGTQTINIGSDAAEKTVILGSVTGASSTAIHAGTGGLNLEPSGTGNITIGNTSGTGSITLGSSLANQTVNVGTGTGNATVNIATASGNNVVLLGGSLGTSTTAIQSGSGGLSLNPGNSGEVKIGNSAGTGRITLGSSTGTQNIDLGVGAGVSIVNIATGSTVANSITLGGKKSLIAVGEEPLEASAAFSINTITKGFLPPRMTTTERNAIVTPAKGLIVFNSSTNALEVNTGTPAVPVWGTATVAASTYPEITSRLTSNYTILGTDSTVLFDASGGNLTATLPSAASFKGKILRVRKDESSTNTLTISPNVMKMGVSTSVIINYARTLKLQSDGSNWVLIEDY